MFFFNYIFKIQDFAILTSGESDPRTSLSAHPRLLSMHGVGIRYRTGGVRGEFRVTIHVSGYQQTRERSRDGRECFLRADVWEQMCFKKKIDRKKKNGRTFFDRKFWDFSKKTHEIFEKFENLKIWDFENLRFWRIAKIKSKNFEIFVFETEKKILEKTFFARFYYFLITHHLGQVSWAQGSSGKHFAHC